MHSKLAGFKRRVECGKERIAEFLDVATAPYVAWSGGKDSECLLILLSEMGRTDVPVFTQGDDLDWPEKRYRGRQITDLLGFRDYTSAMSDVSAVKQFETMPLDGSASIHGTFSHVVRRYVEERQRNGVLMGLRSEESVKRRILRATAGHLYQTQSGEWRSIPIADWSGLDVFALILSRELPYMHVYDCDALPRWQADACASGEGRTTVWHPAELLEPEESDRVRAAVTSIRSTFMSYCLSRPQSRISRMVAVGRQWRQYLLIFGVLTLALGLRLYHLDLTPPGLFFDEAIEGNQARELLQTGNVQVFYPENNGREGLFVWLAAVPLALFGNEPWALRSVSVAAGVLTIWGLYVLANLWFGWRVAMLASALLATSFAHILLSRVAFRAILAPLCLVWALYFYERGRGTFSRLHFALAGFTLGLGLYTYIAFRPMLVLFAGMWLWDFWKSDRRAALAIVPIVGILVTAPLGLYALEHPDQFWGRVSDVSIFQTEDPGRHLRWNLWNTAGMFHVRGDSNGRHNLSPDPLLPLGVGILFLIGCVVVLRGPRRLALIQVVWFGFALAPQIFAQSTPHYLRSIQIVPLAYLIAAEGMAALWTFFESRGSRLQPRLAIAAAVFLIVTTLFEAKKYFIDYGRQPNVPGVFLARYVEAGRKLNALPSGTPVFVVIPDEHFLREGGISMMAQPVMFITDTYTREQQEKRKIRYVTVRPPHLPPSAVVVTLH